MKTKRLVALMMAVMVVIGIFAIPAAAHEDTSEIQPRAETIMCPSCGGTAYLIFKNLQDPPPNDTTIQKCSIHGGYCEFKRYSRYKYFSCSCGYSSHMIYVGEVLKHA